MKIKLIIGLGNPDSQYASTYHNAGILAINYLIGSQPSGFDCRLLKSDVYMNQSGNFVRQALKKYSAKGGSASRRRRGSPLAAGGKIKPEEILIVHDDSDIELGKYKFSFGRGSAGHKGVESVIKTLKTKNFWRLRIGIRPKASKIKAEKFVLKKITKKDLAILNEAFQLIQTRLSIAHLS